MSCSAGESEERGPAVIGDPGIVLGGVEFQIVVICDLFVQISEADVIAEPDGTYLVGDGVITGGKVDFRDLKLADIEAHIVIGVVFVGNGHFYRTANGHGAYFIAALILEVPFQLAGFGFPVGKSVPQFFEEIGARGMKSEDLRRFLESADLVKFAGVQATPEMADEATDSARGYLKGDSMSAV